VSQSHWRDSACIRGGDAMPVRSRSTETAVSRDHPYQDRPGRFPLEGQNETALSLTFEASRSKRAATKQEHFGFLIPYSTRSIRVKLNRPTAAISHNNERQKKKFTITAARASVLAWSDLTGSGRAAVCK
jgi:hypothetical protein